jgi:hypothetical protein
MRKLVRPKVIIPIAAIVALTLLGSGWWWGNQVVDSIEIRNNSDQKVYVVTGISPTECLGNVGPHSTGRIQIRRWDISCDTSIRFYLADERRFRCTWDAATSELVVVTDSGVSCEAPP